MRLQTLQDAVRLGAAVQSLQNLSFPVGRHTLLQLQHKPHVCLWGSRVTCRGLLFCLRRRWRWPAALPDGIFLRSCVSQTGFSDHTASTAETENNNSLYIFFLSWVLLHRITLTKDQTLTFWHQLFQTNRIRWRRWDAEIQTDCTFYKKLSYTLCSHCTGFSAPYRGMRPEVGNHSETAQNS